MSLLTVKNLVETVIAFIRRLEMSFRKYSSASKVIVPCKIVGVFDSIIVTSWSLSNRPLGIPGCLTSVPATYL